MRRTSALAVAAVAAGAIGLATTGAMAEWRPDRPITIIVPWGAGGSTDQVIRLVAGELEDSLGQTVVVVNQPGASGSIGTRSAMEAEPDGYTWTSGAAKDLGTYAVTELLDTTIEDWHLFLAVANVAVVGVNANTPYQDFGELLEAMRERPGEVTVATAGINSSGGAAIGAIGAAADVEYRHVTYDGGNPATIATASGETEVTTQLAVEQAEMIRAGRIRPLAVLSDQPLSLEGHGEIPPITEWLPEFPVADNYFGVFVHESVPDEVVETLERIWAEDISNSEALQTYARERGAFFAPYSGAEARERVMPAIQETAWGLYDRNEATVDPETVGIPRR